MHAFLTHLLHKKVDCTTSLWHKLEADNKHFQAWIPLFIDLFPDYLILLNALMALSFGSFCGNISKSFLMDLQDFDPPANTGLSQAWLDRVGMAYFILGAYTAGLSLGAS
jgi:hypothetical protein